MATIIDGTALARQIRQQVTDRTAELSAQGKVVHLTAILVGSTPAGELYAHRQKETCASLPKERLTASSPAPVSKPLSRSKHLYARVQKRRHP